MTNDEKRKAIAAVLRRAKKRPQDFSDQRGSPAIPNPSNFLDTRGSPPVANPGSYMEKR